jgi:hypothetical protein
MPRELREGPIVVNLSGERARVLAQRLLAPGSDPATERLLVELATLTGGGTRVAHDWDPQTGRLTLAAGR